ncbi:hypothetical protein B566_EDAN002906 [Ephemera danica]|nr:hypothetical protein B566_EDAN002906 [Ephemera danica]
MYLTHKVFFKSILCSQVAWVRVDTQTILSIHHNVITQNPRISLSYNDHRSWYLHISNVQEEDRGWYMCQINTDPMRSRVGYIQVVVPPSILDRETSSDMVVREGSNVSMTCKATGYPEPYVMWRREDGEDINYNGNEVNVIDGELLHVTRVSRLHMGAYLCIASNGVPPSISKRVLLRVQFPPMLSIPNQLEGAYVGQDVALECHTEAYPTSLNYWVTERGDMIVSGDKYEITSIDNSYKKYMKLKIRSVSKRDFGSYKCVAKNSLGETDGVIKLEEIPAPSTTSTTTEIPPPVTAKTGEYHLPRPKLQISKAKKDPYFLFSSILLQGTVIERYERSPQIKTLALKHLMVMREQTRKAEYWKVLPPHSFLRIVCHGSLLAGVKDAPLLSKPDRRLCRYKEKTATAT